MAKNLSKNSRWYKENQSQIATAIVRDFCDCSESPWRRRRWSRRIEVWTRLCSSLFLDELCWKAIWLISCNSARWLCFTCKLCAKNVQHIEEYLPKFVLLWSARRTSWLEVNWQCCRTYCSDSLRSYDKGMIKIIAICQLGATAMGDRDYFSRYSSFWFQVSERKYPSKQSKQQYPQSKTDCSVIFVNFRLHQTWAHKNSEERRSGSMCFRRLCF